MGERQLELYELNQEEEHRLKFEALRDRCAGESKTEINELLFRLLPPNATIEVLDQLACNIVCEVDEIWEAYRDDFIRIRKEDADG